MNKRESIMSQNVCKEETIVKYSALAENDRVFASKYRLFLPTEQELKQLGEHDLTLFELNQKETK